MKTHTVLVKLAEDLYNVSIEDITYEQVDAFYTYLGYRMELEKELQRLDITSTSALYRYLKGDTPSLRELKAKADVLVEELMDVLYDIEDDEGYQHLSYYTKLINHIGTTEGRKDLTWWDNKEDE